MANNNQKQKYMMGLGGTTGGVGMLNLDPINWGAINVKQNKPKLPGLGGGPVPSNSATAPKPAPSPAQTQPQTSPAKQQFVSNLTQNNDALSSLRTGLNNLNTSLGNFAAQQTQAPTANPRKGYEDAFNAYIRSLTPTSDETAAQERLNQIRTQNALDYEKALQSGETLGYATGLAGQQARTAGIQEAGAAATLDALTGRRSALTEAQKARVEFEKSMIGETPDSKPFQAGDTTYQYDPATQTYRSIATKAEQKSAPKIIGSAATGYYTVDDEGTVQPLIGAPRGGGGEDTPSANEIKVFINKQMATPEFQALSDEEKRLYIMSQGGTPYDFGY